jgi:oxygen-independent coproporphyrinogen-3 oxidase
MDLDVSKPSAATEVGSYFVANYPPFSAWSAEHAPLVEKRLDTAPAADSCTPLGLYIHIPFCRKRCKFCYFRVYTDKNSGDVDTYVSALASEVALYADRAALRDREFEFVYFGGGTPSFLSSDQLARLVDRIGEHWSWDAAREVTFECEPGTLKKGKLETIKAIGTTRLSLGIEHFDDEILALNGRAHKSPEVFMAYDWAREIGFDQINVDLIAGMLGDTESTWKCTVDRALALQPDSLTVYQMELPYNTVISHEAKQSGLAPAVADWSTKRAWVDYAFAQFELGGYAVSSAYTVVKHEGNAVDKGSFVYRDSVWHGSDMIGTGVASFSHLNGVHYQNQDSWGDYVGALLDRRALPISRALPLSSDQLLIRELILQLKLGRIDPAYFRAKFGADITEKFSTAFESLVQEHWATVDGDDIRLTRAGLLRVDSLLPRFFEKQFRDIRYT